MKDWHVGQRVVCVSDFVDKKDDIYTTIYPTKGQILTIRSVDIEGDEEIGLRFEEIVNKKEYWNRGYLEASFIDHRFRPLDETRLDQFRVHLKTVPKRVEERV